MEECVKDNLQDAMGGLADCRARIGKANMALNDALGAVGRLEKENQRLKEELEALKRDKEFEQAKSEHLDAFGEKLRIGDVDVSCEYCEEERNMLGMADGFACFVDAVRVEGVCVLPEDEGGKVQSQSRIFIEVQGDEACSLPIRFCPMCGKELMR